MAPIPRQAVHSMSLGKRIGFIVPIAFALIAAASLAACGGDSGESGQSAPDASSTTDATPADATPAVAAELIAFDRVVSEEDRDLYVVAPDGGESRLLNSPGEYPNWSHDGTQLAFLGCLNPPDCTTGLALLDRASGEVRWFPMPDPDLFTACAVWVPSGKELACGGLSEADSARNGVYTVRASDGKGLTRVTSNPGGEDSPLAYSPDGSQLLINRLDPSRGESSNQALFVAPVDGGQPRRITPWGMSDDFASWAPDGRTIVFGSDGALYRVGPDGQGLAEITLQMPDGSSPVAFDVAFSPDGQRIVFSVASPEPGIYTARLDGTDVQRLTNGDDHHANWGAAPSS